MKISEIGKGYLTYGCGIIAIGVAIASQIAGWFETKENLQILWAGLGIIGLRRAIDTK